MNTKEKIEIMQAWLDGKTIEFKKGHKPWATLSMAACTEDEPTWYWGEYEYRIKPEPFECWIALSNDGYAEIITDKRRLKSFNMDYFKVIKVREVEDQ